MRAERFIAPRQIFLRIGIEIAEGGGQAVAAMLLGNAAERPQGVLQSFRQRDETLAAEHHAGVFEAGEGQTCQSASKGDPRSASKKDPLGGWQGMIERRAVRPACGVVRA